MENRANEEQNPRPVSLASAPKFILVGYALLNNKIPVWSVPGFNERLISKYAAHTHTPPPSHVIRQFENTWINTIVWHLPSL